MDIRDSTNTPVMDHLEDTYSRIYAKCFRSGDSNTFRIATKVYLAALADLAAQKANNK
jgi:hypothetical protein